MRGPVCQSDGHICVARMSHLTVSNAARYPTVTAIRRQLGRERLIHPHAQLGARRRCARFRAPRPARAPGPPGRPGRTARSTSRLRPPAGAAAPRSPRAAASSPAPVRAETKTASGHSRLSRSSVSSSAASVLLTTSSSGTLVGADLGEHLADRADLLLRVGVGAVDDVHDQVGLARPPPASSGTPRPAGAAGAGRSRPCRRGCRPGRRRSRARRVVGSRVANSASSTSTPAPVSRLSRRRLAGVGVAGDRHARHRVAAPARRAWCRGSSASPMISRLSREMRVRIRRRSVSILVSPGPRRPTPPPAPPPRPLPPVCRDSASPQPRRRGRKYCSWASSTWALPSWLLACWAKMSRISAVRSMTLTLIRCSSVRSWHGDSSPSQITVSAPVATHHRAQLLDLAAADEGGRVGPAAPLDQPVEHLASRPSWPARPARPGSSRRRSAVPSVQTPDQHHPLQPQLAVLDLGDVGELGGQAGDPAQRVALRELELAVVASANSPDVLARTRGTVTPS